MNRALVFARFAKNNYTALRAPSRECSGDYIGYRELNYEPTRRYKKIFAEGLAGIFWWWIGWHFMTDWRHLVGEFPLPSLANMTDEELGIPKD